MFERFTDRARRVLVLAQEDARLLNHDFIGTEHILLGLIHEGEGVAAKALEYLGISWEAVREKVEEAKDPAEVSVTGSPPFSPKAKKVLELSLREALRLGHNYIGTEHMLLGVVREGEGVGAQVLQLLGADLGRVREQVMTLLSGFTGERDTLAAVAGDLVETTDVPISAVALFGWEDATAVLLAPPLLADARTDRSEAEGVAYETCTYRPRPPPEISLSVAGATVTREAFDEYTSRSIPDAEAVEGLGDAATYSAARSSLRVLIGATLFVVRVRHHPEGRRTAITAAERALANIAGGAGRSVAGT